MVMHPAYADCPKLASHLSPLKSTIIVNRVETCLPYLLRQKNLLSPHQPSPTHLALEFLVVFFMTESCEKLNRETFSFQKKKQPKINLK